MTYINITLIKTYRIINILVEEELVAPKVTFKGKFNIVNDSNNYNNNDNKFIFIKFI